MSCPHCGAEVECVSTTCINTCPMGTCDNCGGLVYVEVRSGEEEK